jgi:hypothetical protein
LDFQLTTLLLLAAAALVLFYQVAVVQAVCVAL